MLLYECDAALRVQGPVFGVAKLFQVAAFALALAGVSNLAVMVDKVMRESDPSVLLDLAH
jgi:hypothetical protein